MAGGLQVAARPAGRAGQHGTVHHAAGAAQAPGVGQRFVAQRVVLRRQQQGRRQAGQARCSARARHTDGRLRPGATGSRASRRPRCSPPARPGRRAATRWPCRRRAWATAGSGRPALAPAGRAPSGRPPPPGCRRLLHRPRTPARPCRPACGVPSRPTPAPHNRPPPPAETDGWGQRVVQRHHHGAGVGQQAGDAGAGFQRTGDKSAGMEMNHQRRNGPGPVAAAAVKAHAKRLLGRDVDLLMGPERPGLDGAETGSGKACHLPEPVKGFNLLRCSRRYVIDLNQ